MSSRPSARLLLPDDDSYPGSSLAVSNDTDFTVAMPEPASSPEILVAPEPDLETRVSGHERHDIRLWLRMLSCCTLIENELRSRLRTEFHTTMPRFDLMSQLTQAPKGMKMSELSRHMMVTNGNVTGITDQLEREGLVERLKDAKDRRSSLIRLTLKGRRYYRKMERAHEAWIQSMLGGVPEESRHALFELLGQVKQSAHAHRPQAS